MQRSLALVSGKENVRFLVLTFKISVQLPSVGSSGLCYTFIMVYTTIYNAYYKNVTLKYNINIIQQTLKCNFLSHNWCNELITHRSPVQLGSWCPHFKKRRRKGAFVTFVVCLVVSWCGVLWEVNETRVLTLQTWLQLYVSPPVIIYIFNTKNTKENYHFLSFFFL